MNAISEERERGAIVIVVTHDQAFADAIGDELLQLHRGRVKESSQSAEEEA